ncbi:MAG: hypothetical protein KatS3mg115_2195 [Candidatus Poribacteria bacterium]|nr:MAG: hypothetical protein KatS3mg115_2195 [Candidatus Poribacteria bacterium]
MRWLEAADFSQVNASCAQTDRFVRAGTMVRPFERMQFLRGSEQLFLDLAESPPELWKLRDLVQRVPPNRSCAYGPKRTWTASP